MPSPLTVQSGASGVVGIRIGPNTKAIFRLSLPPRDKINTAEERERGRFVGSGGDDLIGRFFACCQGTEVDTGEFFEGRGIDSSREGERLW